MKRRSLVALVTLCCVLTGLACTDEGHDPTTAPPEETGLTAEETETAATVIGAMNAISQVGNLVLGAVRNLRPSAAPLGGFSAESRSSFSPATCPSVSVDSNQPRSIDLRMDFGTGCTMNSGFAASGALVAQWRGGDVADSVSVRFEEFVADSCQVDGTLSATGRGSNWSLSFDGMIMSDGTAYAIDAVLGFAFDNHGTPTNPADDVTSVTGGGTLDTGDHTLVIAITQAFVFQTDCAYPVAGILNYHEEADGPIPTPVYTIDFGAGNCCVVSVSVANRSEELDLCVME